MKTKVACDVCGLEMDAGACWDVATDSDLCHEHFRQARLHAARVQRKQLAEWLDATHLKRLRELDTLIADLETQNSAAVVARPLECRVGV